MKIGGNSGGGDFEQPPVGQHVAVLAAIYDIGVQITEWQGEEKRQSKVAFVYELEAQQQDGFPFTLVDTITQSTHKKANLPDVLAAITKTPRGEFVDGEVDTDELIGKCVMLMVAHGRKGSAYIDRVDALQMDKQLDVQGAYGPSDTIHPLVAWHMSRAIDGTVPAGQGDMPAPKGETKNDKDAQRAAAPAAGAGGDMDDIPF